MMELSEYPDWPETGTVSIDFETRDDSLKKHGPGDVRDGYVCGIALSVDGHSFYMPTRHEQGENLNEALVWAYIRRQFAKFKGTMLAYNCGYELGYLAQNKVRIKQEVKVEDPMIAAILLDNRHLDYSMNGVAAREGIEGKSEDAMVKAGERLGIKAKEIKANIWRLDPLDVEEYAIQDTLIPIQLMERFRARMWLSHLIPTFEVECQLPAILAGMRRKGVGIDNEAIDRVETKVVEEKRLALDTLEEITGHRIERVMAVSEVAPAFDAVDIKYPLSPTGKPSIKKDLLQKSDHPAAAALLQAREADKMLTTYIPSLRDGQVNGQLHGQLNALGAKRTTRMSASKPNLQNQPIRNKKIGKEWRSVFVAPKKKLWAKLDFSAQEPRITTHFADALTPSGHVMADRIRDDAFLDLHQMAADIIGIERNPVKAISLGKTYGMGGGKMARDLGLPTEEYLSWSGEWREKAGPEAQALIEKFDTAMPFISELSKVCSDEARHFGYITTLGGHRLQFPRKRSGEVDFAYKALNYRVQGTASWQIKQALIQLHQGCYDIRLTVHDEINLMVNSEVEAIRAAHIMANCLMLRVPSVVDVEVGSNWGDVKKIARIAGGYEL